MANRPQSAQKITKDHSQVAEELQDLLTEYNLDARSVIDTEITKFGANQFLIVVVFSGVYTRWLTVKLAPVITRGITKSRSTSLSLSAVLDWVLSTIRSNSNQVTLTVAAIEKLVSFVRPNTVSVSLSASVESTKNP